MFCAFHGPSALQREHLGGPARPMTALPLRDGVSASCVGLPAGPWPTMLAFLVQRFPAIAEHEWLRRLATGEVLNEQGQPVRADTPYRGHCRLYYYRTLAPEPRIPFDAQVLYRDDRLLVADKPHFLPVTPAGRYLQETLLVRLRRETGLDQLAPVHRIDRETAGLVLFTLRQDARAAYHALFREHRMHKHYEAVAPWRDDLTLPLRHRSRLVSDTHFLRMTESAGTANSDTLVELVQRRDALALYRLTPATGQRHQLRVHMAALGLPIVNDRIYPKLLPQHDADAAAYEAPLQLLARRLHFIDPFDGQPREFESRQRLRW